MPKQYFHAIYSDKPQVMDFIQNALRKNLKPISDYLDIVIKEQQNRQVKTRWEKVETVSYIIEPMYQSLKLKLDQIVTIDLSNWYLLDGDIGEFDLIDCRLFTPPHILEVYDLISYNENRYIKVSGNITTLSMTNMIVNYNKPDMKLIPIKISAIESIQSIKLNGENIPVFHVEHGKIQFSTAIDLNKSVTILINNAIEIKHFNYSYQSVHDLYSDGLKLKVLNYKDNLIRVELNGQIQSIKNSNNINIEFQRVKEQIPKNLYDSNEYLYEFKSNNQHFDLVSDSDIEQEYLYDIECLKYKITKTSRSDEKSIQVKLIDEESDDDNDSAHIKSRLDYFFEDTVKELASEPRIKFDTKRYEVWYPNKEKRTLFLRSTNKYEKLTYEQLPTYLYLVIDTSQNRKQKYAIQELLERPIPTHRKLLLLNEKIAATRKEWDNFSPKQVDEWFVLTDETRDGNETQRRFVRKALATPDFAFLEGPPGSGKTTAILELILQLLKDNKRVLLSASTHVAIDNVLERIIKFKDKVHINPIRIGLETNIYNSSLKKYVLSNMIEDNSNNPFLDVFLQSANLVCGTTIGILQHPHLRYDEASQNAPVEAEYDYLIIDESSKTTYQEFLVTAIRSKKWILVGDKKQLPPYADDFDLIQNFNDLMKNNGLSNLLLGTLIQNGKNISNLKLAIVLSKRDFVELKQELIERKKMDEQFDRNLAILLLDQYDYDDYLKSISVKIDPNDDFLIFKMFSKQILIMNEDTFNTYNEYIPLTHRLIKTVSIDNSAKLSFEYRQNKNESLLSDDDEKRIIEVNDVLQKTWAEHMVWRLKRNFEMRFTNNPEMNIDPYIPAKNRYRFFERYEKLYQIALPSILESLECGIKVKNKLGIINETILNMGFPNDIFEQRHEILEYQHRMDPEISQFSRNSFYDSHALKDSSNVVNRKEWKYYPYERKSVWLNVKPKSKDFRNVNHEEVRVMIGELKKFLEWAKSNPQLDLNGKKIRYEIACLTFYRAQERLIREELRKFPKMQDITSQFVLDNYNTLVVLQTVDKFQGREADITFISMVRRANQRTVGFLDSPNRLNVAMTRARYIRVVIGDYDFFKGYSKSPALQNLAKNMFKKDVNV